MGTPNVRVGGCFALCRRAVPCRVAVRPGACFCVLVLDFSVVLCYTVSVVGGWVVVGGRLWFSVCWGCSSCSSCLCACRCRVLRCRLVGRRALRVVRCLRLVVVRSGLRRRVRRCRRGRCCVVFLRVLLVGSCRRSCRSCRRLVRCRSCLRSVLVVRVRRSCCRCVVRSVVVLCPVVVGRRSSVGRCVVRRGAVLRCSRRVRVLCRRVGCSSCRDVFRGSCVRRVVRRFFLCVRGVVRCFGRWGVPRVAVSIFFWVGGRYAPTHHKKKMLPPEKKRR